MGARVGATVAAPDDAVGATVGAPDDAVGATVGALAGADVGATVGCLVGATVGCAVGATSPGASVLWHVKQLLLVKPKSRWNCVICGMPDAAPVP